ncbi:hypothetical protein ACIP5L_22655 [Streptomyces bacillaris]
MPESKAEPSAFYFAKGDLEKFLALAEHTPQAGYKKTVPARESTGT